MNHIYNRQLSFKTGVMTCRSTVDGVPLGEKLSTLSTEDFEQINDNNNDVLNATTKSVVMQFEISIGCTKVFAPFATTTGK